MKIRLRVGRYGGTSEEWEIQKEWEGHLKIYGEKLRPLTPGDFEKYKNDGTHITALTGQKTTGRDKGALSGMYYVFEPAAQRPCGCFALNGGGRMLRQGIDGEGEYFEIV